MTITYESLVKHFADLPDDELIEIFRSGELIDFAQDIAAAELRKRRINLPRPEPAPPEPIPSAEPEIAPMASSGDLVQLAAFDNLVSANLLQSRLDAEGVPAIVADAFGYGYWSSLVRVLVPESYYERAERIKMKIDRGDYQLDDKVDLG